MTTQTLKLHPQVPLAFTEVPPLALYIHIPWCIKKCPYCDFNSHQVSTSSLSSTSLSDKHSPQIDEKRYLEALLVDFERTLPLIWGRKFLSIFIGGGTPSLMSPAFYESLFSKLRALVPFQNIEITLEANPGTFEAEKFKAYREIGINRLSIGIQSFDDQKLNHLGRIHDSQAACRAIEMAKTAGFDNFNLDLMFGLENQTIENALSDLKTALHFEPTHLSWYQLTLEPNTTFAKHPPILPSHDFLWEMQTAGQTLLANAGFLPYEISAYTHNKPANHNLNYWEFGDYVGIGAGAHGKITDVSQGTITRTLKHKSPKFYLGALEQTQMLSTSTNPFLKESTLLTRAELPFEFMLNALRLMKGVDITLFEARTGLSRDALNGPLSKAINKGLLTHSDRLQPTALGHQFLNDLIELFL